MSRKEIADKTLGEIRSFLDELSNGTSRYRSLHNLTEQVEHQYHGRFLIELIQNAHDALFETGIENTPQRIEIVLVEEEHSHGALYIANDGKPFTASNFSSLSNLGQSDKDPQQSIGNKGIGFRSVLEITKAPQIYSRKERHSSSFDGYCFSFQPEVIQMFEGRIQRVVEGDNHVKSPDVIGGQLLEWDDIRYDNFRKQCQLLEKDWLPQQLAFLSPYTLPIPLDTKEKISQIDDFERRGFSTVVRLPFLSDRAREVATYKLEEMNESTIIFLHRINTLRLVCNGVETSYQREQTPRENDLEQGFEVQISNGKSGSKEYSELYSRYWLWKRTVGGIGNIEERDAIRSAVVDLPGKWPDVDEATVEMAILVSDVPEDGVLNIYLPTQVPSGCAAHFSAPFFGDMSRTDIDFEKPFNLLLLKSIANKAADVVLRSLSGRGKTEAASIVDILAPSDTEEGRLWWGVVEKAFSSRGVEIENQDIVLSDEGWNSLIYTRLLPELYTENVITAELLRSEATYPIFIQLIQNREARIKQLFSAVGISPEATPLDNAATVEAIAKKLHESQETANWSGFWGEVESLLGPEIVLLEGRNVLLGTDNQLHASNEQCSVFFRPRSSGADNEVIAEGGVDDIPENLRAYVAFLSDAIQVHVPRAKGGLQNTKIHAYLSSGLVETYGVERIFSSVLVKATPKLPFGLTHHNSTLCRDILQWGLRLLSVSQGSMDEPIRLLSRLPVPCIGGWYPIGETSFGPGWPEKNGAQLDAFLRNGRTNECNAALERLLLPPDHSLWDGMGLPSLALLEKAGVFNGIRLIPLNGKDWWDDFKIAPWTGVNLPKLCPPGFSEDTWFAYRELIQETESPRYASEFLYELQTFYIVPGFEKLESFDDLVRELFMELLLTSIPSWEMRWPTWNRMTIRKIRGEAHFYSPVSPLALALKETAWLQSDVDNKKIRFRPADRWYIPSPALIGGLHQFSHLMPVPASVASTLRKNPLIVISMTKLGMPTYDPDEETADLRLLNDLAVALDDSSIEISNISVFLGQVRTAWSLYHPDDEDMLPNNLIAQNGAELLVVNPLEENVYLPDATAAVHTGLALHSKFVVALDTKDAKRLRENFQNTYGDGVRLASELTMRPLVDGEVWKEHTDVTLLSEDIPWVASVVLSVFAFAKGQSRGAATKTFTKALDALRRSRIVWVDSLEGGLWHGDSAIARTPVPTLWLPDFNTLLAVSAARTELSLLSEALASIVDRGDIDIALKLVLGDYESAGDITDEVICASLSKLNISTDNYQEVQQRWLGDLTWNIRLTLPLILLMQPDADVAPLDEVSTGEEFKGFLQLCRLAPLDVDSVLTIVRGAEGLSSVGRKAWKILGEQAQLFRWNRVLSHLNESPVSNSQSSEEFQHYLDASHTVMRSIIRAALRHHPELGNFVELDAKLSCIKCPSEHAEHYWSIGFPEVMHEVAKELAAWHVESNIVAIVKNSESADELRNLLAELGLEPDLDPIAIHADNRKMFFRTLEQVQKIAIAWCIREAADAGIWEESNDFFEVQLTEDFSGTAFIDIWDEAMCFTILRKINQEHAHEELWTTLRVSSNVHDMIERLGISDADLTEAHGNLEHRKKKRELLKKTVEVCGSDFVNTEGELANLWDHILEAIEDNDVAEVNLTSVEELKDQATTKKRKKRNKVPTSKKKSKGRMSQSTKDLIGLAGEIHGYRALLKVYGKDAIGPHSWISENSRHKYPENSTNDGFGCDFIVHNNGKDHYIEVKATQGEDEAFELGSSEVELAIDSANRRKKEFIILHVLDALSENPKFRLLPNPYDRKHREKYQFEEAGLRVRYETK
jgi:hypothetical protein